MYAANDANCTGTDQIWRHTAGKQGVNCRPEVGEKARKSRYGYVIDAMAGDSDGDSGWRRG